MTAPADTNPLRGALERRAAQFSMSWGASGAHAEIMAAFAAKEIAALASEPVAGTEREDLKDDVLSVLYTYRDHQPEEDESWESWYFAAFDLACMAVRDVFKRHGSALSPQAGATTASAPERTMVVGRNTKILHEGNQCHGMPHAICHACGLGYECFNADCPNDQPNPMFAPTTPASGAADRAAVIEECVRELETSYPDHAWLNAACAALRAMGCTVPRANRVPAKKVCLYSDGCPMDGPVCHLCAHVQLGGAK